MTANDIIRYPLVTEKDTMYLQPLNKYAFAVQVGATAPEIGKAVEKLYKVKVVAVHVLNYQGKTRRMRNRAGRRPDWKKAIVTLRKGDKIEFA
ncbi:MAG TPA: 50S ribosomal protein L23 [bacterium]|uniref:Large ribosomal subunit protein uL23 n=1 Tax=candidate division TA06 bacterium ADurb.Bin417 TaxID=1852828 RepID=A0A1V5MHM8_UNCT6|nr:MAG: 50S ribosomal protein L23 [candidate division TA06 bacterium ADurb.Bin417]HNQ35333.1 50S ribosomal protein L23 [bacterium]HNS49296.1 50S ribosomal protein L23 [bacterium]